MTRWTRRLAGAPLALLLLTGCPSGGPSAGPAPRRAAVAWVEAAPSAALRAAVDLSPALPGVRGSATAAVVTADGGVAVVVTPDDPSRPVQLVSVDHGLVPIGSVPVAGLTRVWDAHRLPDGRVLLSGEVTGGIGFAVVDPRTGIQRAAPVLPLSAVVQGVRVASVLSPDGTTVYLLVTAGGPGGAWDHLLAVDVTSGAELEDRDLGDDVGAISADALTPYATWLVPRPQGGVGIVFDARISDAATGVVPALLEFGPDLTPAAAPGPLTGLSTSAAVGAVAMGGDGTLFLTVSRTDGAWVLALRPGGDGATPLVRLSASTYGYAVAVDPWQGWAMTPVADGVQAVNLVTGGTRRVDVGCALDGTVRALAPGRIPTLVLAAGRCDAPATGTPMVWLVQL